MSGIYEEGENSKKFYKIVEMLVKIVK